MAKKSEPLHWVAHEYENRVRSPDWFWAVGILAVAIAATSVIMNNVLFAIVVLLSGFALLLYAARKPELLDVFVDDKGVRIDKYFYPYHTLESFWIDEHESRSRVLIKSQKLFMPYIIVPTGDIDPDLLKEHLSMYLPEIFHSESVFHHLMEYLGF